MTYSQTPSGAEAVAARLRAALDPLDLDALAALLDDNVRWGGEEDTPETCHNSADVLNRLAKQRQSGLETAVLEVTPGEHGVLVRLNVRQPAHPGHEHDHEWTVNQALMLRNQRVIDIRGYPNRYSAAVQAGVGVQDPAGIQAQRVTPILNVSNVAESIEWFAKLGWSKTFDWRGEHGTVDFGGVASGPCEVFLCRNGQGGRGDHGAWMSIWVEDVDAVKATCERAGVEVVHSPSNQPWGGREMIIRHPDGHMFRISQALYQEH